jgi:hypothetical protein
VSISSFVIQSPNHIWWKSKNYESSHYEIIFSGLLLLRRLVQVQIFYSVPSSQIPST